MDSAEQVDGDQARLQLHISTSRELLAAEGRMSQGLLTTMPPNAELQALRLARNKLANLRTKIDESCPKPNPKVLLAQLQLLTDADFSSSAVWANPRHFPQPHHTAAGLQRQQKSPCESSVTAPHRLAWTWTST